MARLDRQPYVVVFVHEEHMNAARKLAATLPKDQQDILNAVLCPPGTMDSVDEFARGVGGQVNGSWYSGHFGADKTAHLFTFKLGSTIKTALCDARVIKPGRVGQPKRKCSECAHRLRAQNG